MRDGYKGRIALDPDSEIVTATTVSVANLNDASAAEELIADVLVLGVFSSPKRWATP